MLNQKLSNYLFSVSMGIALVAILLASCNSTPVETTEAKNDRGQLERWQRRKDTFVKEGLYQRLSPEGALLEEAHYKGDSLEGERKYFFANGNSESVENYRNNKLDGKFRAFYESGQLKIEQDFANGAMTGMSIRYYPNGQVEEKVTMKDNVENGPFSEYYENGKLKTEGVYAPNNEGDGLEEGELKEYDDNGQLIRIADCKSGMCLTRWKKG